MAVAVRRVEDPDRRLAPVGRRRQLGAAADEGADQLGDDVAVGAVHRTVAGFGEQLECRLERRLLGEPLVGDDVEAESRAEWFEASARSARRGWSRAR